jgi:putative spermidine/putrescine transport system ATP-binding protein
MSHLVLAGLAKRYGASLAVDDLSLEVRKGESVALLGPSGCGKTTTLRMVAGLIEPSAGRIAVAGQDITTRPAHQRNMGYVFQAYALFPHMSVARNVAFGLEERGLARAERDAAVREALALVRLTGLEQRRPRELSGGQQQRVALARALVIRPEVLLLDESLSNLDAKLRDSMRHEIREIQRQTATTTLFVTHDQVEALTMCDRIAVMESGRIVQVGSPRDVYDRPATRFVASFVGRANVLPVTRVAGGGLQLDGETLFAEGGETGPAFDAFVRPERMRLAGANESVGAGLNRVRGRVARTVFIGERVEVLLETRAGRITIDLPAGGAVPDEGAEMAALWSARDTLLFARAP